MSKVSLDTWTDFYRKANAAGTELSWPSETLVRLFKGNYVPGLQKDFAGKTILDVGCGQGNNLFFLASLGLDIYGTEVSQEVCDTVENKLKSLGYKPSLSVGFNCELPFPDNTFDFLVSWNVIHYENTEEDMRRAIKEYSRVLKPNGRFFLSTTGPEHKILKDSISLGGHRYQIGRDDDFRKGEVFFYFDAPNYIKYYFGEEFIDVLVGRTHDFILTDTLDWFIVTGIKP